MTIQTISADGTGDPVKISNRDAVVSATGSASREVIIIATGDFGGGTIIIEQTDSAGTWFPIPEATFTEAFAKAVSSNIITYYRYAMSGSTAPDVTIRIT